MNFQERITRQFTVHSEISQETLLRLGDRIEAAAVRLANCLLNDGKILCCGNGGSAAEAQHLSSELPKPIRALGQSSDVLVIYTTSGNSANLLKAASAAHDRDMTLIVLSGRDGGPLAPLLRDSDLELRVPSGSTARVQEMHLLMTHCLCDLIDLQLFGE